MDALQRVLWQSTDDLAGQVGIQESVAMRFVDLAGAELIGSYTWQKASLDLDHPSAPANVRDLLSALNAGRIAQDLGMSVSEVWAGLRAFVPRVLQLVERQRAEQARLRRPAALPREPRRRTRAHARASVRLAPSSPLYPRA